MSDGSSLPNESTDLGALRDILFDVYRKSEKLVNQIERLEEAYAEVEGKINSNYFYVASTAQTGRELLEPLNESLLPVAEQNVRRAAIDAVLELRAAVDAACEVVASATVMDSLHDPIDRRWTTRTIGQLRQVRGAIRKGHAMDIFPSALPMVRAGVAEAVRDAAMNVTERMEEVKSVLLAGKYRQSPLLSSNGAVHKSEAPQPYEPPNPALTSSEQRVVQAMSRFDSSLLLTADAIMDEMPVQGRLSARTIGPIVRKLVDVGLAERPEGDRNGARLTSAGRKLASKIAD